VRTYEVVFIAAPDWTVEELDAFTAQMQAVVEGRNGKVLKTESWGKKQLAYKIDKFREGYYVVMTLEGNGAIIAELERRFRVTDHIIRFLSVRLDEDMKRSEKLKAARRRKTARAAAAAAAAKQATPAGEPEAPAEA
jgi:small subunit ribosomal protein S6